MTDALFLFDPQVDDVPVNSDELHAGWKLTLPAHIKRHAVQAMRLKAGDSLQLSDGSGLRIQAVMADPEAGLAEVVEVGREPEPLTRLALIQALAKTGHDEQAIDMATQIGVDQVVPWQADRSIAKWKVGRKTRSGIRYWMPPPSSRGAPLSRNWRRARPARRSWPSAAGPACMAMW